MDGILDEKENYSVRIVICQQWTDMRIRTFYDLNHLSSDHYVKLSSKVAGNLERWKQELAFCLDRAISMSDEDSGCTQFPIVMI